MVDFAKVAEDKITPAHSLQAAVAFAALHGGEI
jgi:hypothetical protein